MPVGTYVTRQMRGVQREGNCLTDHFLALRREYHHPLIWIICQSPESSHRVCTVTAPRLLRSTAVRWPALRVTFVDGSSVLRLPTHLSDGRPLITTRLDLYLRVGGRGGPWIWSGVVKVFPEKGPYTVNRPSYDGKQDDGKSAPFIQFTLVEAVCGGNN